MAASLFTLGLNHQTAPLGFKPKVTGPEYVNEFTRHVINTVAHMVKLEKRTGRTVTLCLEPEPACFLETTDEAVDYFTNHLYASEAVRMLVTATGLNKSQAEAALHKHLGMVYDICHQAVEYEDIGASLRKLADNGIPVFKLQEAAALRVPNVTKETVEAMRPFAETVYLTQTIEKIDGQLNRYLNLEDAFAAFENCHRELAQLRCTLARSDDRPVGTPQTTDPFHDGDQTARASSPMRGRVAAPRPTTRTCNVRRVRNPSSASPSHTLSSALSVSAAPPCQ